MFSRIDDPQLGEVLPVIMNFDETFDLGIDTRTGVDDNDYQVPFRFNGKIDKLTLKLGPPQLTESDRQIMHGSLIRAND